MHYERPNIQRLHAYTPGEQPPAGDMVKLNTNENPYPPADAVLEAIRRVTGESLRRYPPPTAERFRQTAARVHGLDPDQVTATNGGDELLRLAVTVFCRPVGQNNGQATGGSTPARAMASSASGGGVGEAEPSYSLYPVLAAAHDTPLVRVPLDDNFALPDDFAQRCIAGGCRLVLVVNPHAPSGRLEPLERLDRLARALMGHAVLLIDEAYVDFATNDALALVRPDTRRDLDNVLILRSLSKGYSLAGLRFGYGLGHRDLIAALAKARDSYNTDIVAQTAATAALEHRDEAAKTWRAVIEQRDRLTRALTERGWRVPPSQSNFILATPPPGSCAAAQTPSPGTTIAKAIYESLKANAILVRYFDQDRLRDKLRVTIGTPAQNDALLAALNDLVHLKA